MTFASFAQTESISIVQYTASFAEQVNLEDYKDYNSKTYFISILLLFYITMARNN